MLLRHVVVLLLLVALVATVKEESWYETKVQ